MQILVVEDDSLIRAFVIYLLEDAGHQVIQEAAAEAALAREFPAAPEVLVTDVNLGEGMSGFACAAAVRQRWPAMGVVYVSGLWSNVADRPLAANERFLQKPFEVDDLLRAIEDVRPR
jgi:DNA-binding response OmpR family regulator